MGFFKLRGRGGGLSWNGVIGTLFLSTSCSQPYSFKTSRLSQSDLPQNEPVHQTEPGLLPPGRVVDPAKIVFSETITLDYATRSVNSLTCKLVEIKNTGGSPATNLQGSIAPSSTIGTSPNPALAFVFSSNDLKYPGKGGNCGKTLDASKTCQMEVCFYPEFGKFVADGSTKLFAEVSIQYFDESKDQQVSRKLSGVANNRPSLAIIDPKNFSATQLTFKEVIVGDPPAPPYPLSLRFSGPPGSEASSIIFKKVPDGSPFLLIASTCGSVTTMSINNRECEFKVQFNPTDPNQIKIFQESIEVNYSDGATFGSGTSGDEGLVASFNLSGESWSQAHIEASPKPLVFINPLAIGKTTSQNVTFTHRGTLAAENVRLELDASPNFSLPNPTACPSLLNPGSTCSVRVEFHPQTVGTLTTQIRIVHNAGSLPVDISGQGVENLSFSSPPPFMDTALDDGLPTDTRFVRSTILTNISDRTLTITGISISGANPNSFIFLGGQFNDCMNEQATSGVTLSTAAVRLNCEIRVHFKPQSLRSNNAILRVTYSDGLRNGINLDLSLSGVGISNLVVDTPLPSTDGFLPRYVGNSSSDSKTWTIQNNSLTRSTTLKSSDFLNLSPNFYKDNSVSNPCPNTIGPSIITCTVDIKFRPNSGPPAPGPSATVAPSILHSKLFSLNYEDPIGGTDKLLINSFNLSGPALNDLTIEGIAVGESPPSGRTYNTSTATATFETVPVGDTAGVGPAFIIMVRNNATSNTQNPQSRQLTITNMPNGEAVIDALDPNNSQTKVGEFKVKFSASNPNASCFLSVSPVQPVLEANSLCTFEMKYVPLAETLGKAQFHFTYTDVQGNTNVQSPKGNLEGSGRPKLVANLDFTSPWVMPVGNTTELKFIEISNVSSQPVSLQSFSVGPIDTEFTSSTGPQACQFTTTLAAIGGTNGSNKCKIYFSFSPVEYGSRTRTLNLSYLPPVVNTTTQLTPVSFDTVGGSILQIDPPLANNRHNFGTVAVGDLRPHEITVKNLSNSNRTINFILLPSDSAITSTNHFRRNSAIPTDRCQTGIQVGPGAQCRLAFQYQPQSVGAHSASPVIQYNDGQNNSTSNPSPNSDIPSDLTFDLDGTGIHNLAITPQTSPTPFPFGNVAVGNTSVSVFTITNVSLDNPISFRPESLNLNFIILTVTNQTNPSHCALDTAVPGNYIVGTEKFCELNLEFRPRSIGIHDASLDISYDHPSITPVATSIHSNHQGAGIAPLSLALNPITIDFTDVKVGDENIQSITIQNAAVTPITINPSVSGARSSLFEITNNCLNQVPATNSLCTLNIKFKPTTFETVSNVALNVDYQLPVNPATSAPQLSRVINATVAKSIDFNTPIPTIAPTALNSQSTSIPIVVKNWSNQNTNPQTVTCALSSPSKFSFASGGNGCSSAALGPQGTCQMNIIYQPDNTSSLNTPFETANLSCSTILDSLTTQTISHTLVGNPYSPASLAIVPANVHHFGSVRVNSVNSFTFTLENSGSVNATGLSFPSLANTGFSYTGSLPGSVPKRSAQGVNGTANYTVQFTSSAAGSQSFTGSINFKKHPGSPANDDSTSFNVTALAVNFAELIISGNNAPPFSPAPTPTTSFSKRWVGSGAVRKTFTVQNIRNAIASNFLASVSNSKFQIILDNGPNSRSCKGSTSLGINQSCDIVIETTPDATIPSVDSTQLSLQFNDGFSPTSIVTHPVHLMITATTVQPIQVASGLKYTCAINEMGKVYCWGSNSDGQIGAVPNSGPNTSFNLIQDLIAKSIAVGYQHACAIRHDGTVTCWGNNELGRLGRDTSTSFEAPTPSSSINLGVNRIATAISLGLEHSCALLDNRSVKCWGKNGTSGLLGFEKSDLAFGSSTGQFSMNNTPLVILGNNAIAISANTGHTCAVLETTSQFNELKCWGNNSVAQLGQETNSSVGALPASMSNLKGVKLGSGISAKSVSAGNGHTCALLTNDGVNSVKCWGDAYDATPGTLHGKTGRLGTCWKAGVTLLPSQPYPPCDGTESQVLLSYGDIPGQMGDSLSALSFGLPGLNPEAISSGYQHSCVILKDSLGATQVKCFGKNDKGQLGSGKALDTIRGADPGRQMGINLEKAILNLSKITGISTGNDHTCAWDASDPGIQKIQCWGNNENGALGRDPANLPISNIPIDVNLP